MIKAEEKQNKQAAARPLSRLEAKVKAVNMAHEYANTIRPRLVELFTPLVGEQVFTAAGPLLKKVQAKVDALDLRGGAPEGVEVFRDTMSTSEIRFTVRARVTAAADRSMSSVTMYHEIGVTVGWLEYGGGVLKEILPADPHGAFKTGYTAEGVEALRAAYRAAKDAADAAKSALYPFDEYDR